MNYDFNALDDLMRNVIQAPGYLEKRTLDELADDARPYGFVLEDNSLKIDDATIPMKGEIHCEWYLPSSSNPFDTIVHLRFTAIGKEVQRTSTDNGFISPKRNIFVLSGKTARCFEISISVDMEKEIWLYPKIHDDYLFEISFKNMGVFVSGATFDLSQKLYVALKDLSLRGSELKPYEKPCYSLKHIFLKNSKVQIEYEDLPKLKRGIWKPEMIQRCRDDSKKLKDLQKMIRTLLID